MTEQPPSYSSGTSHRAYALFMDDSRKPPQIMPRFVAEASGAVVAMIRVGNSPPPGQGASGRQMDGGSALMIGDVCRVRVGRLCVAWRGSGQVTRPPGDAVFPAGHRRRDIGVVFSAAGRLLPASHRAGEVAAAVMRPARPTARRLR